LPENQVQTKKKKEKDKEDETPNGKMYIPTETSCVE
jgi:hypothetical protein